MDGHELWLREKERFPGWYNDNINQRSGIVLWIYPEGRWKISLR
jgi:hypothetical protein